MLEDATLKAVANRHDATPAQVALAWLLRQEGVGVIPRAGTEEHIRQNRDALDLQLTEEDLTELDGDFRPPRHPQPLEIL